MPKHIAIVEDNDRVAYEGLTLRAARDGRVLVRQLSLDVPSGMRLLVRSPDNAARSALFDATAGIFDEGEGRIVRPALGRIAFLPERPYLPPGTLREVVVGEMEDSAVVDEAIYRALAALGGQKIVTRVGGLDREADWDDFLSLGEQEMVSIARVILSRPRFVFLHNPGRTLDAEQIDLALKELCDCTTTCVTLTGIDEEDGHLSHHDALLELSPDGGWSWRPIRNGTIVDDEVRRESTP